MRGAKIDTQEFYQLLFTAADIIDGLIPVTPDTDPKAVRMIKTLIFNSERTEYVKAYKAAEMAVARECFREGIPN